MDRRKFFRHAFLKSTAYVDDCLDAYKEVAGHIRDSISPLIPGEDDKPVPDFVRPPGSLAEADFLKACTRCDDCIKACPHWVIRKAGPGLGEGVMDTPIIIPKASPCLFCTDLPCIASCESGALKMPSEKTPLRIGLAWVDDEKCFNCHSAPCDYCMIHCPTVPRAIQVGAFGMLPEVSKIDCTGCGRCAQICPADAIRISDARSI